MAEPTTLRFNRLEVKYMVDRPTRTALTRDLSALMRPDKHAGSDGAYRVRSLYFDTADYMAYHEKMAGTAVRHKLRARVYGDEPGQADMVRLEVKSRYLSYIFKSAFDVSRDDYRAIDEAIRARLLPPARLLRSSGAREFFRLQSQYHFEPKIIVQYRRQAFERREINRARVNFDDELLATRHLELLGPLRGGRRLLSYGHSIFEIKVDEALPYWLHMLIRKYNLSNQALSKFCYGVQSQARYTSLSRQAEAPL